MKVLDLFSGLGGARMICSKETLDIIPCECYECKEEEE